MKILDGIKELIYNFTHQISDSNLFESDISDDNFVAIAAANGMSPKAIAELVGTRNGINNNNTKSKTFESDSKMTKQEEKELKSNIKIKNEDEIER